MTTYKRKTKIKLAVSQAQADQCARNILIGLGVNSDWLPVNTAVENVAPSPLPIRKPITVPSDGQRFRRTNQEIREHELLSEWQIRRRGGESVPFNLTSELT